MRAAQAAASAGLGLSRPVSARDHRQGTAEARLMLVEYGDYECPFCGAAHTVIQRLQKELGRDLCFVFRNFPLAEIHRFAMLGARAAEAADLQGRFWPMHDLILEEQAALEPAFIPVWAQRAGLDLERFRLDLKSPAVAERIAQDLRGGLDSGVEGTPTFFVNGMRFIGAPTFSGLRQALLHPRRPS